MTGIVCISDLIPPLEPGISFQNQYPTQYCITVTSCWLTHQTTLHPPYPLLLGTYHHMNQHGTIMDPHCQLCSLKTMTFLLLHPLCPLHQWTLTKTKSLFETRTGTCILPWRVIPSSHHQLLLILHTWSGGTLAMTASGKKFPVWTTMSLWMLRLPTGSAMMCLKGVAVIISDISKT